MRAGLGSRPEALRDLVGPSLCGTACARPTPRGTTFEPLALRPLLGARSGEAKWENPRAERSLFPQPITMTHFNKGPSYGLSAEVKNKVRPGSGGVPATGRRRAAPPPARLGLLALRSGGVGAAESGCASVSCPGLEAPALGALLALFPRRGPDERRAGGSQLLESRRSGLGAWEPVVAAGRGLPGRGHSCTVTRS